MLIRNVPKNNLIIFIFCSLFFAHSLTFAQNNNKNDDLNEDDFFAEIPTILTVSRLEQPLSEAPASVTVINREKIMAAGVREIADIFRLVPGFIVGHVRGNNPVVTYQGNGYDFNRQLQVLIDGRSVFVPSFGGIPWANLPLIIEDIEKIEITRGPNAASYGSNSFLAVINIITREASQDQGINYSINYSNDKDIADAYISINHQYNDINWKLSANVQNDDGFEEIGTHIPNNDSTQVSKFNFKTDFHSDDNTIWSLQIGQSSADLGIGDTTLTNQIRDEKTLNRYQNLQYATSQHNSTSTIKLLHTEYDVDDFFQIDYEVAPSVTIPANINFGRYSERSELELQHTLDVSTQLRLVLGASYRRDVVNSFFLLGEDKKQNIDVKRLFSHAEYKISDDKIINIGTMLEHSEHVKSSNSPRLSYVQHLSSNNTLRVAYSKAFRNPILFETVGRWAFDLEVPTSLIGLVPDPIELNTPNKDLKPEEINAFEIGFNHHLKRSLEADIKVYRYQIENQIETNLSNSQYINTSNKTKVKGVEASISYQPSYSWFVYSGINLSKASNKDPKREESFPKKTAFILSQYELNKNHTVSGALYYINELNWFDFKNLDQGSTKKLDLRYAYNFNQKSPLSIELIGQNLLDNYADYKKENIQTATYFIKLSGTF